ncbi:MAG: fibronectin type III domain-containing protein [Campylobacterales bacterium]|nr:fibronectin type III domain-containing protein [Campylobacterales bacterium]
MRYYLKMILLSIVSIFWISGCSTTSPTTPKQIIDPNLPKVAQINYIADITSIGLEWNTIYDQKVKGYKIYRKDPTVDEPAKLIATIDDRYSNHYVDGNLKPNNLYFYTIATFSNENKESESSEVIQIKTVPTLEKVVAIKAISNLPNRVKVIFKPHNNERVKGYIIERSDLKDTEWKEVGKVENRLLAEYLDKELKNNYTYRYRVIAYTFDDIKSPPSDVLEATTKPLPNTIENLTISNNQPKRIILSWNPTTNSDTLYYKIYRGLTSFKIGFEYIAKTTDTRFVDNINKDGASYYYRVTVVDKDGLESEFQQNAVMGTTLAPPTAPTITSVNFDENSCIVRWSLNDKRANSFIVVKKSGSIFSPKIEKIPNIRDTKFVDRNLTPGVKYKYAIMSVDEYGIVSEESTEAEFQLSEPSKR